jgi:ferritin-like metal-binding protein YciE
MKNRHTTQSATGSRRSGVESIRDEIIDWLRDAYAMEQSMEASLQKHAGNDDLSPQVSSRSRIHLEETRRHADDIKAALESLDADTSSLKTAVGVIAQATKGLASTFARDEQIKDILDAYSMEHFEIACYLALIAGAEKAGLSQIANTCQRILADEERMAKSLKDSLPGEVAQYLDSTQFNSR